MRRTNIFLATAIAATLSGAAGCKWTDFDDLENETWVRSTEDPELGANDYAVAIAGVETGAAGGSLLVISDDSPNLSTLEFAVDGSSSVGTSPAPLKLGTQNIGSIADQPVFAVDTTGANLALVERSINGTSFALMIGSPTAPAGKEVTSPDMPVPSADAVAFAGSTILFAAGSKIYRVPTTGMASSCAIVDGASMPVQVAGMGVHTTNLVVWTKTGTVLRYSTAAFDPCTTAVAPLAGQITIADFIPGPGARVHVVNNFAVLAARATTSRIGQAYVIDMTTFTTVGTAFAIEGLRSTVIAELGGTTYFVVGISDKSIGGVITGAVELHELSTSGAIAETAAVVLHDAEPKSGQQFGRTVATMSFRGNQILVVGAAAEVFAYFRTAVYDHLP